VTVFRQLAAGTAKTAPVAAAAPTADPTAAASDRGASTTVRAVPSDAEGSGAQSDGPGLDARRLAIVAV
jgi:hypothetical protein